MDKLVLDIETKNTFADVGGEQNIHNLEVSFVGVYSYNQDKFLSFFEGDLPALRPLIQNCGLMIGFAMNRFDLPVLAKHFDINLMALPRLDLLEEVELNFGRRIGLDILAKTNLGVGKSHSTGLEAIRLYKEGKLEELRSYCLQDVKITRDLYELAKKQGYLMIPKRDSPEVVKVEFKWPAFTLPTTLF